MSTNSGGSLAALNLKIEKILGDRVILKPLTRWNEAYKELQYTRIDLDDFIEKRPLFTEDEWIDLLVQSVGFNPTRFERRVKMLMLMRLVPFVEPNYNLIELGPRETGKTYTFRNTSNRAFVVSGGKATPATLFFNKATRKLGVVGLKHLVFFDEIANTRFDDAEASISVLKDYMQTGKFSRGDQEFSAQCSIVLGGNIDTDLELREPAARYSHLFEPLPPELQDPAFLDRIHAYLPGWEMPKIRPENYATGYGFLTDYLAEIFTELRRRNFQTHVNAWIDLGAMTGRNQDAIKKKRRRPPETAPSPPQRRGDHPGRNHPHHRTSRRDAQTHHRPTGSCPACGILECELCVRTI